MNAVYVITTYCAKKAGFLIEDQTLKEARFFSDSSNLGNIYTGVVEKILPSIGAAFVDVGLDGPLYLSVEKEEWPVFVRHGKQSTLRPGDVVLVQYVREGIKTKRPSASATLSLTGDYCVLSLKPEMGISKNISDAAVRRELKQGAEEVLSELVRDEAEESPMRRVGVIIRTAASLAEPECVLREIRELFSRMKGIIARGCSSTPKCLIEKGGMDEIRYAGMLAKKQQYDTFSFITNEYDTYDRLMRQSYPENTGVSFYDEGENGVGILSVYNIKRDMDRALGKKVYLKSGGSLVIEVTEALSVIDVNSGKSISGSNQENNQFKTNMEAVSEIATQLRLRNLSGIILIDFINMKQKEHNEEMLRALKAAIAKDPTKTIFVDITALGLVELTRKKENKPLHEMIQD